jgi:uncharacterized Zn finger protein
MIQERLPQLTESVIRRLANEPSFMRGKSYYHDGAILDPIRQGMELRADCQGSQYEPYQVSATLTNNGVAGTSCTCPYGGPGICKHIVALLLTYVHKPHALRVIPPLQAMLAQRSQAELIALIGEMVRQNPHLLAVVELSAASQEGRPIDVEAYRRQVRRALRDGSPPAVERELYAVRETADRLEKRRDWLGAGAVYRLLLTETVSHYGDELQMMDEDGDIAMMVDEFAQGLSRCLKEGQPDGNTRHAWLEALLAAELTDIELGGIDLAPSARDAVLEHASDEDWAWIEKEVRAQIHKSRDWEREVLVNFLSEWRGHQRQDKEAAALIRELGTPEQRALLLLDEGKMDEAVPLMRQVITGKPGLVTQFADALVEVGAAEAAVALVAEHAQGERTSVWCTEWLAQYYGKHGSPREAVEWQQRVFLQQPSVEAFKALRQASRKIGAWERVRAEALKALESKKQIGALIEITLHEGNVRRALELLPRLSRWELPNYQAEVAQAAEQSHHREAVALYKELAERAIGGRQRTAYQEAVRYLKRVKALYQSLNAQSDWDTYLQSLRRQYAHLPALQDEWRKARL